MTAQSVCVSVYVLFSCTVKVVLRAHSAVGIMSVSIEHTLEIYKNMPSVNTSSIL